MNEQALCLASVETTLCGRLVCEGRLFLDTIFCSVLDGGEMFVKLEESGGRINLDSVLADSFFLTSRTEISCDLPAFIASFSRDFAKISCPNINGPQNWAQIIRPTKEALCSHLWPYQGCKQSSNFYSRSGKKWLEMIRPLVPKTRNDTAYWGFRPYFPVA